MEDAQARKTLNELLVELFNHILYLEEKNLQDQGITLSMSEVHILENIEKSSTKTMSDVARLNLVTQGTLTVAIHRLVEKGYVIRQKDETDKRIVRLSLPSSAIEILSAHALFHEKMIDHCIDDLHVDEDQMLITSLSKVMNYFKANY